MIKNIIWDSIFPVGAKEYLRYYFFLVDLARFFFLFFEPGGLPGPLFFEASRSFASRSNVFGSFVLSVDKKAIDGLLLALLEIQIERHAICAYDGINTPK